MRAANLTTATGLATLRAFALAAPAGAQSKRAPSIRIYSENADVLSTSAYITPAIQVAENAYVFAVAMARLYERIVSGPMSNIASSGGMPSRLTA